VYTFTVNDLDTWTQPWTAEILFNATDARIFELAVTKPITLWRTYSARTGEGPELKKLRP
jgi:hypothetical protein